MEKRALGSSLEVSRLRRPASEFRRSGEPGEHALPPAVLPGPVVRPSRRG
jgi:hypothetical protein